MKLEFEDVWGHRIPSAAELHTIPTIDAAGPDDWQVLVPHPGVPDPAVASEAEPIPADGLADKPWVRSVVAEWPIQLGTDAPDVRTLISLHTFRLTRDLLERLPNLEQVTAGDITPDDLATLHRLRDVSFGWASYDIPAGVDHLQFLGNMDAAEPYRRATVGAAGLAELRSIERLDVRGFRHREPADPVAELTNLRWLRLHGWRNLRTLGALADLEQLELLEFEMANLRAFRGLTRLRTLALMGRMDSLVGIENLVELRDVWLRGRVVRDLAPLAELPRLETLELVYPDAVSDFGPIDRLRGLRRLKITLGNDTEAGSLPSISFLSGLERLEELELINVEIKDGRLDPLVELPQLRQVLLTGRAGPNVDELQQRRPEIAITTHLSGEPEGRVHIGPIHYDPPAPGIEQWSILQSLADLLRTGTNHAAEQRVRAELRRRDPALLKRLDFDSEAGAVGIYAGSEADIRAVAEAIGGMMSGGDGRADVARDVP